MLRIGLTGGIGSGKSTVARIFNTLGILVYDADSASKRLMSEEGALKESIKKHFGEDAYSGYELNRAYLANRVFNNPTQLSLLNSLVHPATILDAEKWMSAQNAPYCIKEAALIFESGSQKDLDYVIGVSTPLPLRIHRTMQRDQVSSEQVKARISKQLDEEIKMRLCDYVIVNDEQELLIPQVLKLHEVFLKMNG